MKLTARQKPVCYLMAQDENLASVIRATGEISYEIYEDYYDFLVRTVVSQMLSNKVAAVLCARLSALCGGEITLENIKNLSDESIKKAGISSSKIGYIRDLGRRIESGELNLDALNAVGDDEVVSQLRKVRGIGAWSAKMFLIFALGRQDVLPYEDGAFLSAFKRAFSLQSYDKDVIYDYCERWRPYRSVAARFLYKALDSGKLKG